MRVTTVLIIQASRHPIIQMTKVRKTVARRPIIQAKTVALQRRIARRLAAQPQILVLVLNLVRLTRVMMPHHRRQVRRNRVQRPRQLRRRLILQMTGANRTCLVF